METERDGEEHGGGGRGRRTETAKEKEV